MCLMAVRSNTFTTTMELPTSHTATLLSTQKITDFKFKSMEEVTAPSTTAILCVLQKYFFYPDSSLSTLRVPLQQGCKQGTHPGKLFSSSMLYPTIWNHTRMGQWHLGGSHVIAVLATFFFTVQLCLHM